MNRIPIIIILLMFSVNLCSGHSNIEDIIDAEKWCDNTSLHRVEGIWIFPEEDLTVLIQRSPLREGEYKIISIDAFTESFYPGETIGLIAATTDPLQFKLNLFTRRKNNILTSSKECSAKLTLDDYAMQVSYKKHRLSINPFFLLPRFWRLARLSTSNPTDQLPVGMKKIYPSYDGNGTSKFNPRYL